ncbi:MAG: hypothetical protein JXA97_14255 [Anaerolineales bacterium]|nr:hypothetical protein [Anaerolineales bacterium]
MNDPLAADKCFLPAAAAIVFRGLERLTSSDDPGENRYKAVGDPGMD